MNSKPVLGRAEVERIAAAAQGEARARGWPVTIAIVDDGGHLLWLQREEGAGPATAAIATAKAQTAALGRRESRFYEEMIQGGRVAFVTMPDLGALVEGGVPLLVDGQVVGAVGVSGVRSADDALVARAGCGALGSAGPAARPT